MTYSARRRSGTYTRRFEVSYNMDVTSSLPTVSPTVPIDKPKEYKCDRCYHVVTASDVCPVCGNVHLTEMCPNDTCTCTHSPMGGIAFCEICGEPVCPVCGNRHLVEMCPNDTCACTHSPMGGIAFCEICGEPVCPICGAHDVVQLSRITGYIQDVSGWNAGKRKELELRRRYTVS